MTPRRRKSTKRSAASSKQRRSASVTILVDECLGRYAVPEALKAAGARVLLHSQLFPAGIDDEQWLRALAARRDISVISKDRQIRRRTLEHEAVIAGRVRLFSLTTAGMNSREQADIFVRALRRIERCSRQPGPFVAIVTASGAVRIVVDSRSQARSRERKRRRQGRKK
jgi:PIN like domain